MARVRRYSPNKQAGRGKTSHDERGIQLKVGPLIEKSNVFTFVVLFRGEASRSIESLEFLSLRIHSILRQ